MAHFYGTVSGRSPTDGTRCGTKASGLKVTCNGWNLGASCSIYHAKDEDILSIAVTHGSSYNNETPFRLTVRESELPQLLDFQNLLDKILNSKAAPALMGIDPALDQAIERKLKCQNQST